MPKAMMKTFGAAAIAASILGAAIATAPRSAQAAGEAVPIPSYDWSFSGIFGTFDRAAMQRGFQVYTEVCASCHGLEYIAFRNLAALGYDEDQIKAIAATYTVEDGPDDFGEMFEREAIPADRFPPPFANENAARAAMGGAYPPDLSLMTKKRANGVNYLHALLIGYEDPPAGVEVPEGQYWNAYFPGHLISMPPPLLEDQVEFSDGTPATVEQMSSDLTTFLAWAAEPMMEERKRMGVKALLFLLVLTALLYAVKRKIWADIH